MTQQPLACLCAFVSSEGEKLLQAVCCSAYAVTKRGIVAQVLRRRIAVSREQSEEGGSELLGQEVVEQRVFTLQEVKLLGQLAGYSAVAGVYGDYDAAIGLQHKEAYRLVMLLTK